MPEHEHEPERRDNRKSMADVEAAFDRKLKEHEQRDYVRIDEMFEKLKKEAFPDGPIKHGDWHLAKLNAAKEEAEYWKAAKLELTKAGVGAVLTVLKGVLILALLGLLFKLGFGSAATALIGMTK